jgi:hypothetical protein
MKRLIVLTVAVTILCALTSPAAAKGLYVGAGIGNTFFSAEYQDALDEIQKIDENSTAWKIFGGYTTPSILGLEGGYRDFGTVKSHNEERSIESQTKGWDVAGMVRLQIAIVDVFGKVGAFFWKSEAKVGELFGDDTGTDLIWGLGAGVHLGPIGVRLEWESVEMSSADNLSVVMLGATFGF